MGQGKNVKLQLLVCNMNCEVHKSDVHFLTVHEHLPAPAHVSEAVLTSLLSVRVRVSFVGSRTAVTGHEATVGERRLDFTTGKSNQIQVPERGERASLHRDRIDSGSHQWRFKVGQN